MSLNTKAPAFVKDPHFYIDNDGFHLRDGAPPEIVQEFNNFVDNQKKENERGVFI